jgi:hypothetical protein
MRKVYFLLFVNLFGISTLFAQIPNNSFETWTTVGTHVNPDNWGNLNDATAAASIYTCLKGTPGNPGTAYLKLISKTVSGLGVVPGVAVCGTLNLTTQKPKAGFPYTVRSQTLTGKWQHMSASDQGFIDVLLTRWNNTLSKRDTIAYTHKTLGSMAMSWTTFSITLNYVNGATPDSAIIFCSASPATPVVNDYLYLDNLTFSGTVVGVNEVSFNNTTASIYPNPCRNNLNLSVYSEKPEHVLIQLYDITGKMMKTEDFGIVNGTYEKNISINMLPKGLYFVKFISDANSIVKYFVVE